MTGFVALCQTPQPVEGAVSYKSGQNIYIKFNSTAGIQTGDTLFIRQDGVLIPAVEVKNISSISVMGIPIGDVTLNVSDTVVFTPKQAPVAASEETKEPSVPEPVQSPAETTEPPKPPGTMPAALQESIRGRLSVSMYHTASGGDAPTTQRMRYIFSLQAKHIQGSKWSAETYVSYRHQFRDWVADNSDRATALRVYTLALRYDFNEFTNVAVGRKINNNITNLGAIDGLHMEHMIHKFTFGGFAGSRPDYTDYSINTNLRAYGGFIGFRTPTAHGTMQSSLAIVEQRNNHTTDRRFAYLQQSGMLSKNLSLFASAEFDLYERVDSVPRNTIHFTSTYLSLQYRPSRKLMLFGSYDARKNVIYFESYKSFIDQLIEQETRQGLRFRATYRMAKTITLGSSIGYRFQKAQGNNSMNMQYYVSQSRIPWIKASGTASVIILHNDYIKGLVYGIRLSRDILKQKVYGELEYRKVNYTYGNSELKLPQDILGVNLTWRIRKKLSLGLDYEGVFAAQSNSHVHLNLVQRF